MKKITAIILDWAGTTIDYGSCAPVDAFARAFAAFGLNPSIEEIRAPMGMQKRAHIEKMMEGKPHTKEDIDKIYDEFEPALFEVLENYADPLPGVLETVNTLRAMGIKIGSTTGYTEAMMDVVAPSANKKGYSPDCMVCPDHTGGIGRPYPYMLWRNLEKLGISSIGEVLKAGDTEADILEGKNAGCLSVGILKGSSMFAMTNDEHIARQKYLDAGADYVIDDITALPRLIKEINKDV